MAKRSPQTFQKLQREREKQRKRKEKQDRRLDRKDAKRHGVSEDGTPSDGLERDPDDPERAPETGEGEEGRAEERPQDPL